MEKKKITILTIVVFVVGLIIAGSSYAFWSWTSNINKNLVFNTASNLRNYIVYNEGESAFTGELQVSNSYQTGSVHATVSIYKTTNVNMLATLHMDVNQIGPNMKNSTALKWVVTEGTVSNVGSELAHGNFVGANNGDLLTLVPDINITTTEAFYTVWIWIDSSENPSDNISGETLDTDIWMEINQVEGSEDRYEITNTNAHYQQVSATVVDNKYKVTRYAITTTNSDPSTWTTITPTTEQNNVYTLIESVSGTGTYYIWFMDSEGRVTCEQVVVTEVDTTKPSCSWGAFTPNTVQNNATSSVTLTCTDSESGIGVYNLQASDFTPSNNKITVTNVTRESVTNGYKYTITVTGTTNDGTSHLTVDANKIRNGAGLGNLSTSSGDISVVNVINITLDNASATTNGTSTIYLSYNDGIYLDSGLINQMTDSTNPITIPVRTYYSFLGYYDNTTQMIDSDGHITSNFTNTLYSSAKTLNAHWQDTTSPIASLSVSITNNTINATATVSDNGDGFDGNYHWLVSTSNTCDQNVDINDFTTTTTNTYSHVMQDNNLYYVCLMVKDNADNETYSVSQGLSNIVVSFNSKTADNISFSNKYVAYNQVYGEFPTTTKTGYTLKGWSLAEDASYIPNTYQQVEYLQSTGTQYIDTGYIPNENSRLWLDYQPTEAQSKIYAGARNESSSPKVYFTINSGSNNTKMYASWGTTVNYNIGPMTTDRVRTEIGSEGIYYNDEYVTMPGETVWSNISYSVYLFAVQESSNTASLNASVKIYEAKIYEGNTLIHHMIPCYRKSDNVRGMYDAISGEFYTNSGTGTFGIGSDVNNYVTESTTVSKNENHTLYAVWKDEEAPTGTLTLSDDNWIITATVSASDTGSGVKPRYGFKMIDTNNCNSSVTGFVETSVNSYTFSDSLKYYVCVRIQDNEGNYNYLSQRIPASYYLYTGDVQSFTAPSDGYYFVETYGAQGGEETNGGYSSGYIELNANDVLYVYVGGSGAERDSTGLGGWNGGGNTLDNGNGKKGPAGGGATDIRLTNGAWDNATSLNSRIMVAGGGSGWYGVGGTLVGKPGQETSYQYYQHVGKGGAQTAGGGEPIIYSTATSNGTAGGFGTGGTGGGSRSGTTTGGGAGGGGGYYGGSGASGIADGVLGGGGGSSFISGYAGANAITSASDRTHTNNTKHYSNKYFIDNKMTAGVNSGNGRARIKPVDSIPQRVNTDLNNVRYVKDCISGNSQDDYNTWVEIEVIENGVNIADGITATGITPYYGYDISYLTNGDITPLEYVQSSVIGSPSCVILDLGETYNVDEIAVWHIWNDGRTYNNNVTYVSNDGILYVPVINNQTPETSNGKRVTAWDNPLEDNTPRAEFNYTGDYQTFTVPESGYYKIETWGAEGGFANYSTKYNGGAGGYSSGYINLTANDTLYIYVGGMGSSVSGTSSATVTDNGFGYNGGGPAGFYASNSNGGGGGGATDVRTVSGAWNDTTSLNSRIMVAGGGGAARSHSSTPRYSGTGGTGGGLIAGNGVAGNTYCYALGIGGKQNTAGTSTTCSSDGHAYSNNALFGYGWYDYSTTVAYQSGNTTAEGGGGGYYGGGIGYHAPSGGGSSFISGYAGVNAITSASDRTHTNNTKHYSNKYFINGSMSSGVNTGNGKATVTYAGATMPRTNTDLNNVRYIKDCINGSSSNIGNHWVELQAIQNGINLAKNKAVTGTHSEKTDRPYSVITDGLLLTTSTMYAAPSYDGGMQCITVDLGATYNLDEIAIWHFYDDGRTYYDNTTSVSSDNIFFIPVINRQEAETANGKRVSAWDQPLADNEPRAIYYYIGNYQTFTAPQSGYYKIEAWGAQGGGGPKGGYVSGYINLTANDTLYIYAGGKGLSSNSSSGTGGYNGGGSTEATSGKRGPTGGGATDIRLVSGTWNNATSLNSRIMVAAGGGGYYNTASYGIGGGLLGVDGADSAYTYYVSVGKAGMQRSGGATPTKDSGASTNGTAGGFGTGGKGGASGTGVSTGGGSGGGGGYYGGSGASGLSNGSFGAGGGSSFISGYAGVNAITSASDRTHTNNTKHYSNKYFIDSTMSSGVSSDNGQVIIKYAGPSHSSVNSALNGIRYIKDCINGNTLNTYNQWIEIQAIQDGVNLAKNKTITGTANAESGYEYTYIVDGMIDNSKYGRTPSNSGLQCVTIDLENTYDLDEVAVWHVWTDGRSFNDNVTYVSSNNTDWAIIIANEDVETHNGKRFNRWQEYNQYIECEAGTYLAAGGTTCITCPAGSACPGGIYEYSMTSANGINACAAGKFSTGGAESCTNCVAGSYSGTGASGCIACAAGKTNTAGSGSCSSNCSNSAGVSTWYTPTWNSNNTMTNSCKVNTCSSSYHINGNACAKNSYTKTQVDCVYTSYKATSSSASFTYGGNQSGCTSACSAYSGTCSALNGSPSSATLWRCTYTKYTCPNYGATLASNHRCYYTTTQTTTSTTTDCTPKTEFSTCNYSNRGKSNVTCS